MDPAEARRTLLTMVAGRGKTLADLTAPAAVDLMLGFYGEVRASNVVGLDEDGDMMLFEWGAFSFGEVPSFELGLTRQFIHVDDDDDMVTQLVLMLHYEVSTETRELGRGHRWCHRPEGLEVFRRFVESSQAFRLVGDRVPTRVELKYEQV